MHLSRKLYSSLLMSRTLDDYYFYLQVAIIVDGIVCEVVTIYGTYADASTIVNVFCFDRANIYCISSIQQQGQKNENSDCCQHAEK